MKYKAFGMIIASELALPELPVSGGVTDINIMFGNVPEHLEVPITKTPWYEAAKGKFLLTVDGIAKYDVENGNSVVIEPYKDAKEEDIRVFLLSTVFTVLLHQRNYLVLHGSAAAIDGKAVAFVGPSNVGKTAIAFTLYHRGYNVLTDEICAIKIQDGKAMLFPGIPQLNVWHDTLLREEQDVKNYAPIRQGLEKYAVSVGEQFCPVAIEVSNIILLKQHDQETIHCETIKGGEKFKRLMKNSYRVDWMEAVADKEQHFKLCAATVFTTHLLQVTFNDQPYRVNQLIEFIVEELK